MKKLIVLILSQLIATVSYSQILYPRILSDSTVVITNAQLKNANKLFYQGEMYKKLHSEDSIQISNYKKQISNYERIDSVQNKDLNDVTEALKKSEKKFSITTKVLGGIILILTGWLIF